MKFFAALLVLFLFVFTANAVEKPLTLADTLTVIAEALSATGKVESLEIDRIENSIKVTSVGGRTRTLFPENLHQLLRSLEIVQERDAALVRYVAGAVSSLERDNQMFTRGDLGNVLPIIRNRTFAAGLDVEPITKPFAGDLAVFYVQDHGRTVNYLTVEEITQAGIGLDEIEAAAARNVVQLLPKLTVEGQEVNFLVLDGFYETAFLVTSDYWTSVAAQFGPIAMIVPNRDLVAFAPANDAQLVQFLRNTAKTYSVEQPWPVSDQVFYWKGTGPWTTKP